MTIATLLCTVLYWWLQQNEKYQNLDIVPHEQIYNMNTIFMQVNQAVDEVKLKLLKVNSVHKSPINFTILPYFFLILKH